MEDEKMIELNKYSNEELIKLKEQITNELLKRNPQKKVLYKTDCYNSSDYHHNKYKHWARIIKSIDETKTNGYAFIGEKIEIRKESLVPINSFIVECCGYDLKIYKVNGNDDKEIILTGRYNKFVSFIQEAKELINL